AFREGARARATGGPGAAGAADPAAPRPPGRAGGLGWPLPRQRRVPAAPPARGSVAGPLGPPGGGAPRGPLLLLSAKPHTARPRRDPYTRQPGRPPRHGPQPAA